MSKRCPWYVWQSWHMLLWLWRTLTFNFYRNAKHHIVALKGITPGRKNWWTLTDTGCSDIIWQFNLNPQAFLRKGSSTEWRLNFSDSWLATQYLSGGEDCFEDSGRNVEFNHTHPVSLSVYYVKYRKTPEISTPPKISTLHFLQTFAVGCNASKVHTPPPQI